MRDMLIREIITSITDEDVDTDRIKNRLTLILNNYDITDRCTELTVKDEDDCAKYLRLFFMSKKAAGRTARTLEFYEQGLRFFFDFVHRKSPLEVTSDDIKMFVVHKQMQGNVSAVSQNNYLRCISAFYTWMMKEDYVTKNPMDKVEKVKEKKEQKTAFTETDIEKMRLQIGANLRLRCIFEMLLSTWCRVNELAQMKISDISPDFDYAVVLGKGEKERRCYINATARLYLEKYLNERQDDNIYLFPSSINEGQNATVAGRHILQVTCSEHHLKPYDWWKIPELVGKGHVDGDSSIGNVIRNLGKRAGVEKVHPHRFRRTGATFALRKGMPIEAVSKLLGHKSIETTQIYLDITEDCLEQAHRKYV